MLTNDARTIAVFETQQDQAWNAFQEHVMRNLSIYKALRDECVTFVSRARSQLEGAETNEVLLRCSAIIAIDAAAAAVFRRGREIEELS